MRILLCLLCLTMVGGLAASSSSSRLQPGAGRYPDRLPNSGGAWESNTQPQPAPVGSREAVCFPLKAGADVMDGESFSLGISAASLDLSSAQIILVRDSEGSLFARELNFILSKGAGPNGIDVLRCDLTVDSSWREGTMYLLLMATRTMDGGAVTLQLSSQPLKAFTNGDTVHVGDYTISKQSGESLTIPVGMSGVANASSAYIIRRDGSEKLRVIMDGSLVLGLAVREAGLVVGLDFDVAQKVYVSSLTQKMLHSRTDMQRIFSDLDFSFMRPPIEQNWLDRQESYSYSRSFDF